MSPLWILIVFEVFSIVSAVEHAFSFVSYYEKLVSTDIKVINQLPSKVLSEMIRNMSRTKRDSHFKHFYNMYSPAMTKSLSFHAFGREFLLHLHKDTKIIDDDLVLIEVDNTMSRTVSRPEGLDFYVGYVHGEPATALSHVYWDDENIVATINTRNETYIIEPAKRYNRRMKDAMVAYRLSDMKDEVIDSIDFCQMVYAPKLSKVNKTKRQASPTNSTFRKMEKGSNESDSIEKGCTMFIVADVTYHINVGESNYFKSVKYLIGMFSRINAIYLTTNFSSNTKYSIVISQIMVHKNESADAYNKLDKSWSAHLLLYEFSKRNSGGYCLAHLVTFTQLVDALGLAYVSRSGEMGGICSGCITELRTGMQCLNTGVSSILYMDKMLPSPQGDLVVAHEIGHGFGSPHDSDNCVPSKLKGGRHLMFPRTNTGKDVNNKLFSWCSIESMRHSLSGNDGCFIRKAAEYCGNGIVEGREECDAPYKFGAPTKCCDANCKLLKDAVCSPTNSMCCTAKCSPSEKVIICKHGDAMKCLEPAYCDGVSAECPANDFVADGTDCLNGGKCLNGTCTSACVLAGLEDCLCTNHDDKCYLCCAKGNESCLRHSKKIGLTDGSDCVSGACSEGICMAVIEAQLKTIRAWDIISYEHFDSMKKFISNNVIMVIICSTLIPYLFICYYICRKDYDAMIEEKELRIWYSTRSTELFWKKSKVKVRVVPDVKSKGLY